MPVAYLRPIMNRFPGGCFATTRKSSSPLGRSCFVSLKITIVLVTLTVTDQGLPNGILRDGSGARSMSLGGFGVALSEDPLSALHSNPATLSTMPAPTLAL